MPLFEFVCSQCGSQFEELVRSASVIEGVICPSCQSEDVTKKISTFASKITGGGSSFSLGSSTASCAPGGT